MAAVVIRNLPDAVHQNLKARAKAHGKSTEAEMRDILIDAAGQPKTARGSLGTDLHNLWKDTGGWDLHLPPRAEPMRDVNSTGPEWGEPDDDP